jgi:hypothetical protein
MTADPAPEKASLPYGPGECDDSHIQSAKARL